MDQQKSTSIEKSRYTDKPQNDEAQIRQIVSDMTEAIKRGDLNKIMSFYAPDVVAYDLVAPLEFRGVEEYRKPWEEWLSKMQLPIEQSVEKTEIVCSGDLAFCRNLVRMHGITKQGQNMECRMRNTCCLQKKNGEWRIIHEHLSVPVDMKNDKPLWNLRTGEEDPLH